jgi:hypothetical protein
VEASRIRAETRVVVSDEPFSEVIKTHSANADLVFMGIQKQNEEDPVMLHQRTNAVLAELPTSILVCSSGEADLFA